MGSWGSSCEFRGGFDLFWAILRLLVFGDQVCIVIVMLVAMIAKSNSAGGNFCEARSRWEVRDREE